MHELKELAQRRILAKQVEDAAIADRRAIDSTIAKLLADPNKPEGTINQMPEGFKVSVTYSVNRKLDTKKLQEDWNVIPAAIRSCVNWKADLSTTKFRDLGNEEVLTLSNYMKTTPASPTVKVESLA